MPSELANLHSVIGLFWHLSAETPLYSNLIMTMPGPTKFRGRPLVEFLLFANKSAQLFDFSRFG